MPFVSFVKLCICCCCLFLKLSIISKTDTFLKNCSKANFKVNFKLGFTAFLCRVQHISMHFKNGFYFSNSVRFADIFGNINIGVSSEECS
jgi:hypothetical protein